MSSYGCVLDVLDERYLNLQDVFGNVEPFPQLVPYEQYVDTPIVYRMDTIHELFVGLLQQFTDRISRRQGKELWTWFVQWEVEEPAMNVGTPVTKKARFSDAPATPSGSKEPRKPALTSVERRCLRPQLFLEEDMQRILIDIMQAESKLLPNFVEFLYQWIDFYEGDGKALYAAVRHEIPSLWLFAEHPRPLNNTVPWASEQEDKDKEGEKMQDKKESKAGIEEAAEKIGEKVTRKKPNIAALEAMAEDSERLQYREVKFGLQRPINPKDEPMPPLFNIPSEPRARSKYFAACFKNRQRASWLLQEAGVTAKQIQNYKKLQEMPPKETPIDFEGDGYINYYKDMPYAQEQFAINESMARLREKQTEIAISNRLAEEARLAAHSAASPSRRSSFSVHNPAPLIPLTPSHGGFGDHVAVSTSQAAAMEKRRMEAVREVCSSVFGKLRSKVYARAGASPPFPPPKDPLSKSDDLFESDSDSDSTSNDSEDSDGGPSDDDDDGDPMDITASVHPTLGAMARPPAAQPNAVPPTLPVQGNASSVQNPSGNNPTPNVPLQQAHSQSTAPIPSVPPTSPVVPDAAAVAAYTQHLNNAHASASNMPPQPSGEQPATSERPSSPVPSTYLRSMPMASIMDIVPYLQPVTREYLRAHMGELPSSTRQLLQTRLDAHEASESTTNVNSSPQTGSFSNVENAQGSGTLGSVPTQSLPGGTVPTLNAGFASQPAVPSITITPSTSDTANQPQSATFAPRPPQMFNQNPYLQAVPGPSGAPQSTTPLPSGPTPTLSQTPTRAAPPATLNLNPTPPTPGLMTPLATLANNLTLTSPEAASPNGIPILIYMPRIVLPKDGNISQANDSLMLGYTRPGTGLITLSKAIFLTTHVWENILNRVRKGHQTVLESYGVPHNHPSARHSLAGHLTPAGRRPTMPNNPDEVQGPHRTLYDKLVQAYHFMAGCSDREAEVTKRWRVSMGPMTERERGAVWEGWGVWVDKGIGICEGERRGACVMASVDPVVWDEEAVLRECRRREIESMIEEDEERSDSDDDGVARFRDQEE